MEARAAELSALYRSGTTDLHAHFEQQQRAAEPPSGNAKQYKLPKRKRWFTSSAHWRMPSVSRCGSS
jgi:hypothetical protein